MMAEVARAKHAAGMSQKAQSIEQTSGSGHNQECTTETRADASAGVQAQEEPVEVLIVGAGVAGCSLAYTLGKQGRKVLVLERDLSEPDRIVGELLQPGGYLKLKELGLQDCVDEIDAQRVDGYVMFKGGEEAVLRYPLDGYDGSVAGRSFHNGRFIMRLRAAAMSAPGVTVQEANVTSLIEDTHGAVRGVTCKGKDGSLRQVFAQLTFVCDGCFSRLRRGLTSAEVAQPSHFVGLVLKDCKLPHPNHGHVVLADSPVLFYPISSNEVRCLVDVPSEAVQGAKGNMKKYLTETVAPTLPLVLRTPFLAAVLDGSSIKSMPNSILPAAPIERPGALLLGDAFNMRHPLTGGGMTVALSDIAILASMFKGIGDLSDKRRVNEYTRDFYLQRKPVAATINTLACALYKVFRSSSDDALEAMRQACFDYLRLGGWMSSGPVGLLSGLNPRPMSLVMHFFAVAVYGVGRMMLPLPTPWSLWKGARLLKGATKIIGPIIRDEGIAHVFFPSLVRLFSRKRRRPADEPEEEASKDGKDEAAASSVTTDGSRPRSEESGQSPRGKASSTPSKGEGRKRHKKSH
eukprot:jgi/Mesvir1/21930/Mv04927-RA.1